MLKRFVSGKNFLYTQNNQHAFGFTNALYILGTPEENYLPDAVVCVPYSYKNNILNKTHSAISFYPVEKQIVLTDQEDLSEVQASQNCIPFKSLTTKAEYLKRVASLKKHIQRGDIYEINFCMEFVAENVSIDPFSVFHALNKLGSPPYAALARFNNTYIISASPELFLHKQGSRLITKPIKGTCKRGGDEASDLLLKQNLQNSLKEQTENVMIVDVARNDFSILAQKASVEVPALFAIESFKTVHQMVSTVSCRLKHEVTFKDIIHANFPMPSMTGAPKIRAMELIDSHEQFSREIYSGTLGYIDSKGDFTLSVLIRTLVYDTANKTLSFAVGSAITHLCDPEEEYQECLLKAEALLKSVNGIIAQ